MLVQKMIRILGRMIFYMLLVPLLIGIIYTLAHDQWLAAVILMVLCIFALYKGLIRIKIQANSLAVRDGKVVFFIPEKTVRDRFDFASRGQTIVQLPHFGLLDKPYRMEIFSPDSGGGVNSCRLSLKLGYVMELAGWQRLYDNFALHQDQLSLLVKQELFKSSVRLPFPQVDAADLDESLQPLVAELNLGLENFGLQIEEATCTFTSGPTLVRFVAAEQELVEKALLPGSEA
jgi:hypothetical protein